MRERRTPRLDAALADFPDTFLGSVSSAADREMLAVLREDALRRTKAKRALSKVGR